MADDEKRAIAAAVVDEFRAGQVIGLNGGPITTQVAHRLTEAGTEVTVVTNAVNIAFELTASGISVVVIGGALQPTTYQTTGPIALEALANLHLDWAILGANGVDQGFGGSTRSEAEAAVGRMLPITPTRWYWRSIIDNWGDLHYFGWCRGNLCMRWLVIGTEHPRCQDGDSNRRTTCRWEVVFGGFVGQGGDKGAFLQDGEHLGQKTARMGPSYPQDHLPSRVGLLTPKTTVKRWTVVRARQDRVSNCNHTRVLGKSRCAVTDFPECDSNCRPGNSGGWLSWSEAISRRRFVSTEQGNLNHGVRIALSAPNMIFTF